MQTELPPQEACLLTSHLFLPVHPPLTPKSTRSTLFISPTPRSQSPQNPTRSLRGSRPSLRGASAGLGQGGAGPPRQEDREAPPLSSCVAQLLWAGPGSVLGGACRRDRFLRASLNSHSAPPAGLWVPLCRETLGRAHSGRGCPRTTERESAPHLEALATTGMLSSFRSLKTNIQRSLVHDGSLGAARSSRLPSLSMTEIMLARRGVTAPCTRFQRVCLQRETSGPALGQRSRSGKGHGHPPSGTSLLVRHTGPGRCAECPVASADYRTLFLRGCGHITNCNPRGLTPGRKRRLSLQRRKCPLGCLCFQYVGTHREFRALCWGNSMTMATETPRVKGTDANYEKGGRPQSCQVSAGCRASPGGLCRRRDPGAGPARASGLPGVGLSNPERAEDFGPNTQRVTSLSPRLWPWGSGLWRAA